MLPVLFIGVAAATGALGAGKTAKAISTNNAAKKINTMANERVEKARNKLEQKRQEVSTALEELGEIKVHVLANSVTNFVETFEKIKNVDFQNSVGLEELKNLHIDQKEFEELKALGNFATTIAGGATAGALGGALTALGAYSAATTFAYASTGAAISSLSGAAATNATLAFFGGGSLAAGGLGMAGGTMVLSSLVAGPALLVMGIITDAKAQEKVNDALANKAEADEIVEALTASAAQCVAIRRRSNMFYNVLTHLDTYFLPQVWKLQDIVKNEGVDYRAYTTESKKAVAMAASSAISIKSILDTPILSEDGSLTVESEEALKKIGEVLNSKWNND